MFTSVFSRSSKAKNLGCEEWSGGIRVYAQSMSEPFDNFVSVNLSPGGGAYLFTIEAELTNTPP